MGGTREKDLSSLVLGQTTVFDSQ
uniref:Uncharacterized protein n=1 Tax=Moniliophthora roreri TaxID=221103 RepID=A0A0W0FVC6_MONRR